MRHLHILRPYRASFHFFVTISTNIWAALPLEKAAEQQNTCSQVITWIA